MRAFEGETRGSLSTRDGTYARTLASIHLSLAIPIRLVA